MSLQHSPAYLNAVTAERHRNAELARTARSDRAAARDITPAADSRRLGCRLTGPLRRLLHAAAHA
jgi:hypothetical protein